MTDTIVHNAKIATNALPSFVEAIAIEDGRARRREDQLGHGAAGRRRHGEYPLLGRGAAERRHEARHEPIEVVRGDVDVGRVLLRADGHRRRLGGRARLRGGAGRAPEEDRCQGERVDHAHEPVDSIMSERRSAWTVMSSRSRVGARATL
jgi:hypothetical protein